MNIEDTILKIKECINRIANVYPTFINNNRDEPLERLACAIQYELFKEQTQLQFLLENTVELLKLPANTPIKLFPNGKIRIEGMGTYNSINEAYNRLQRKLGNFSAETINDS